MKPGQLFPNANPSWFKLIENCINLFLKLCQDTKQLSIQKICLDLMYTYTSRQRYPKSSVYRASSNTCIPDLCSYASSACLKTLDSLLYSQHLQVAVRSSASLFDIKHKLDVTHLNVPESNLCSQSWKYLFLNPSWMQFHFIWVFYSSHCS